MSNIHFFIGSNYNFRGFQVYVILGAYNTSSLNGDAEPTRASYFDGTQFFIPNGIAFRWQEI